MIATRQHVGTQAFQAHGGTMPTAKEHGTTMSEADFRQNLMNGAIFATQT